jgi:excinuclease UvrABC ATPase subunit
MSEKNLTDQIMDSIVLNNLSAYSDLLELYQEEGYSKKKIDRALTSLINTEKIAIDETENFDLII